MIKVTDLDSSKGKAVSWPKDIRYPH